jgi:hypothetical protein
MAAPKGNKFALGNNGGRPRKFNSAEEMQEAIDKYYQDCKDSEKPKTFSGLALALDMTTECLRLYGETEEYFAIVKKARQLVEEEVESRLFGNNATGSIFWLKNNAKYQDRRELSHSFTLEDIIAGSQE